MLTYFDAIVLGIVEGLTEFLPVSSTGHLTIAEKMLGLRVDDKAVTAYTVIIQFGAIVATFLFFAKKIARLFMAWVLWSGVMVWAEKQHDRSAADGVQRGEGQVTLRDGLIIGLVQCFSLIPGVSRSGATISAGLLRGIDRVTATELSFFMAIPALTAGGVFQAIEERHGLAELGAGPMLVGIVVAFVVAYASIAWLLKFVANNSLMAFVNYRVVVGLALAAALANLTCGTACAGRGKPAP